jgi:cellulose biosynthesis protein BcsQ
MATKTQTGKVVTFMSFERGQSKTTLALHLASRLPRSKVFDYDESAGNRSASRIVNRGKQAGSPLPFEVTNDLDDIGEALNTYDFILIDTEGGLPLDKAAALSDGISDVIIVPTKLDYVSIEGCLDVMDSDFVRDNNAPVYALFTAVDNHSKLAAFQDEFARHHRNTLESYLPFNPTLADLSKRGMTADHAQTDSGLLAVRQAFDAIASEVQRIA